MPDRPLRKGDRVILATGLCRDRLLRGDVERVHRYVEIAEVRLDTGKTMAWPTEWIFREDGSDA